MLIEPTTIEFKYTKISELFGTKWYFPIFQRFYTWKKKNIKDLMDDLENAIDNPNKQLYLLDFIWYEDEGNNYIADGQQRIVTINLLIKIINEIIEDKKLNITKPEYIDVEYESPEMNEKYHEAFDNYIRAPFKQVYMDLRDFVKETIGVDRLNSLVQVLNEQIYIYMRKVDGAELAFSIFTQINTGGKPLTNDDIVKATIDEYKNIYKIQIDYKRPKELSKQMEAYYKFVTNSSNDYDANIVMHFLKENVIKTKQQFQDFANYVTQMNANKDNPIKTVIEYVKRSQILDIINIMAIKGIDLKNNKKYITDVILPLCLMGINWTINRRNPSGAVSKFYSDIIKAIKDNAKIEDLQKKIIEFANVKENMCKVTYDKFVDALGGNKTLFKSQKEAILIMDIIRCNTSSDLNMKHINLEHIYPQTPSIDWDKNGWPTDKDERKEITSNIGNFMILNESVNKTIKNKYLDVKIPEYKKKKENDLTLTTEMNTVDYDRLTAERGNYIKERQEKIADIIYNNFELAKVLIEK